MKMKMIIRLIEVIDYLKPKRWIIDNETSRSLLLPLLPAHFAPERLCPPAPAARTVLASDTVCESGVTTK